MTHPALHLVVPGRLDQRTGGYIYDRRIAAGLRDLGRPPVVHCLPGIFPGPDTGAEQALEATLSGLPDGSTVVIDGLALGGLPGPAGRHRRRLTLLGLVHHPLCEETGLSAERAAELEALERSALRCCHGLVATSPHTAERLQQWLQPAPPMRVVTPGIDRTVVRHPSMETASAPVLLCVGALVPRKGQDLLLRALAQVRDRSWHCVLAGSDARDPLFADRVRAEIARLDLAGVVEIRGECTEQALGELYRRADVFVLPSWYEGYGMAFTEAMAHGLPVVATRGGAIPSTVPATAGLLIAPGDMDALAQALAEVLDDPELRATLARGAWEHARALPSWEAVSGQFATAVAELEAP
ncbi:MAG: glycosyltransferase family 1 protein [Thioalkalivibrio sp.]|nr:MAG: glycosyltransferase family 1 protein [Thioalkalivibrio sp.]